MSQKRDMGHPSLWCVQTWATRQAQDRLQQRLGLKVRIEDRKGKGRVIIEYAGLDDFDAILAALGE